MQQVALDISDDDARIAAGFERFYDVLRRLTPREELEPDRRLDAAPAGDLRPAPAQ